MPRKNPVQPCIFCGKIPCACGGEPVAKPARKKLKPRQDSPASVLPDAAPWEPPTDETISRFTKVEETETKTEDQLLLEAAIRNIAPLLTGQERLRYESVIDPPIPVPVERDLFDWRKRNGLL